MSTLMEWFSEPTKQSPFEYNWRPRGLPEEPTRLQVYACLVGMNGGRVTVYGWGCSSNDGIYGRIGLEQNEALCLMQMSSFVEGWLAATGGAEVQSFAAAMNAEWERVEAAAKAENDGRAGR